MITTIGILLFDGVEELDFGGPWEVFTMAAECGADQLDSLGEGKVIRDARYIADGNLVTAAGIDMALWLTGQVFGDELARTTQKYMEYEPAPPHDVTGWVPREAGYGDRYSEQ